jgi:outer membrane protein assembly factor BamB
MYQGDQTRSADACSSIDATTIASSVPSWFFPTAGDVTATPTVVNGTVFVGDATGAFYAIKQSTGTKEWEFDALSKQSCFIDTMQPHATAHAAYVGAITSSATVVTVEGTPTVYVGADGSIFALNARTGRCLWAQDTDPAKPRSGVEVESSPVVDTALTPPELLVGNDDNGKPGVAVTGLMAFNATTGALLWKYEPERDLTLTPAEFGGSDARTLDCGDSVAGAPYCAPAHIAGLAPNSTTYADACGDVRSSPALDTSFVDPSGNNSFQGSGRPPAAWRSKLITRFGMQSPDGLVVFGTANCAARPVPAIARYHGDYIDNQSVFAVDPVTGVRVWNFVEPYNSHDKNANEPMGGGDDFGSSPVLARVPAENVTSGRCARQNTSTSLAIEGSTDGYAYGLCEATGVSVWARQVGQPSRPNQASVGSIGGYIASPSLGTDKGRAAVFFDSGIPLPVSNDGTLGSGDKNISSCPGAVLDRLQLLKVCPDLRLAAHPSLLLPVTAVDAGTGAFDWKAASVPTYAATSYTNGIVFAPQSLALSIVAYDASTGLPVWAFQLGAAPSSGAAIAGRGVYLGAGTSFGTVDGKQIPPQATGVWGFTDMLALPPRKSAIMS